MKNTLRLFVLVALASLLVTSVAFCAARNAPVQPSSVLHEGPSGGNCIPGQSCVPVVDSQPIVPVLQDGPNGGGCPPTQNCIPIAETQVTPLVLADLPSGDGCPPTVKCVPKAKTL